MKTVNCEVVYPFVYDIHTNNNGSTNYAVLTLEK